jgi:hypothetical protein
LLLHTAPLFFLSPLLPSLRYKPSLCSSSTLYPQLTFLWELVKSITTSRSSSLHPSPSQQNSTDSIALTWLDPLDTLDPASGPDQSLSVP